MKTEIQSELDPERIKALLHTQRYGRSLRVLALTESTNDDASRDAAAGAPDGHVVVANAQSAGRGSHGRPWSSPADSDLYLSIVARPELPLAELPPLTLAVGLGVAETVQSCLAAATAMPQVKWPNDIWIAGRKCAGILVEASSHGSQLGPVVIGIGLNLNRTQFPEELRSVATSVREWTQSARLDRGLVLASMLERVERWVDRFLSSGGEIIASALQERLALRGQRVRCGAVEGQVVGVAASGALRIASESGIHEVVAGPLERLD